LQGFDHLLLYVGNAKQAADWYVARFGFTHVAFANLVTGSRAVATHVVRQNKILLAFASALNPSGPVSKEIGAHMQTHGDAVKDVAFTVDDCRGIYDVAVRRGAVSVKAPYDMKDEFGVVTMATIRTYGDCTHTFVQRNNYTGVFLPGFRAITEVDPFVSFAGPAGLDFIDHCVGNQDDNAMMPVVQWYEQVLQFHRFWSVDDSQVHTEYSALRSIVMVDYDRVIKMPLNEPAEGRRKSQIKEYCEYHGGAGIQHVALNTRNIINAVNMLRKRGVKFLTIPATYYKNLRERIAKSPVKDKLKEDINVLEQLHILVDFDDQGYLLQLFTEPVEDRPTLFYEVIQRENHEGFGAGNFKALFESIEIQQAERGNSVAY